MADKIDVNGYPRSFFNPGWLMVPGTPDYVTEDGLYYATYKYTHRSGHACYWTFPANLPKRKRTMKNAVCVGGLSNHFGANAFERHVVHA